eukprot:GHUV01028175.1.p1 GENE.GHUV01028175.1~~GHUV01028175.1.p1  ORF type:complete len:195 (+),score=59.54 GHUV01028175.1:147-731(+)
MPGKLSMLQRSNRAHAVRVVAYRDSSALRKAQEMRAKHILQTYNQAYRVFPKVKFVLKHNSRLGEVWKLPGGCPELGSWSPELSPSLHWQEGGIWSAEVALPPGEYSFKCMLRRADGSYVWEEGENRHLLVPVKDRAGHMVLTYHMDVRIERVESLQVPQGCYSAMLQDERAALQQLLEPSVQPGRVLAGAYGR